MKRLEQPKGPPDRPLPNDVRRARDLVRRCLPPLIAAVALMLLDHRRAAAVAAAAALVLMALSLAVPSIASSLDRAVAALGEAVARLLSSALSTLTWLVAVLPAWLWNKVTFNRSLTCKAKFPRSYWTRSSAIYGRSSSGEIVGPFRTVATESPGISGLRRTATYAVFALVALVALIPNLPGNTEAEVPDPSSDGLQVHPQFLPGAPPDVASGKVATSHAGVEVDQYTHENEPWAPRYFGELNEVPYRPDLILGSTLKDFRGTYLNIANGRRVSYTPPDPEITVWFFGGSTMFGVGQRDDHTIPSEVARLAAEDGIRIRPENFGVTAYVNWQETEKFEQLLTLGKETADLAVFYDGLNDNSLASERSNIGDTFLDVTRRKPMSAYEQRLSRHIVGNADPVPYSPERTTVEINSAASQYRRGVDVARILGKAYGVPVMHFWQPEPFTKIPNAHDEELWRRTGYDPQQIPAQRERYDAVRVKSGVNPIDLSRVLDDLNEPVYFDGGHTNEFGAKLVAEAMYAKLHPKLLELAE